MKDPVLVVLAAGMGSRYGGMKQIDPVGPNDQLIIDYSIYDARRAGFKKVVFIIKYEIEEAFKEAIGDRLSKIMEVDYAYQQLDDLPPGYHVPEGRTKPWGTSHAVLAARDIIDGPFAVINADDYYGPEAYQVIYDYLVAHKDEPGEYCMVGYLLKNTVTDNGSVARGVCVAGDDGFLKDINERTRIEKFEEGIKYTEDEGKTWVDLPDDTPVSMNLWGFNAGIMQEMQAQFAGHLDRFYKTNPLKGEFFIPFSVSALINEGKARVKILKSSDKWFGVTYKEDKPEVEAAIRAKTDAGLYPENLWA